MDSSISCELSWHLGRAVASQLGLFVTDELLGHYGKMNTGVTFKGMKTEIQSIFTRLNNIQAVFGFGSFFRGEEFKDIEFVLVARDGEQNCLAKCYESKVS